MLLKTNLPSLARSFLVFCAFTPTYVRSLPAALSAAGRSSVRLAAAEPARSLVSVIPPSFNVVRAVRTPSWGEKPAAENEKKVGKSYEDIGPKGRCETPIGKRSTGVITPTPAKMDWKACSSQGGIGWLFGNQCYGMAGAAKLEDATLMGLCHFPSKSVTPETYQRGVGPSLPKTTQRRLGGRDQRPSMMLISGFVRDINSREVNRGAKVDHADDKQPSTSRPARPLPKVPSTIPSNGPPSGLVPITVNAPIIHRPIPLRATEYGSPSHDWNVKSPAPPSQSQPKRHERRNKTPTSPSPSRLTSPLPPPPPAPGPEQTKFPPLRAAALGRSKSRSSSRSRSKSPQPPHAPPPAPGPEHTKFPPVQET